MLILFYGCIVQLNCKHSIIILHGTVAWSAVCDCGISSSYSLTFLNQLINKKNYVLHVINCVVERFL